MQASRLLIETLLHLLISMTISNRFQSEYRYIFGPVVSRRLGMSLGVDLMPHKTCTLNCVYCECGKTTHLVKTRKEYVPIREVIGELDVFLKNHPAIDYITFSGSGEPTLHRRIQDIVDFLKTHYPSYPVALLTNATLFYRPEVRRAVRDVDLIIASLDAGTPEVFRKVNRPHPGLDFTAICEGLEILGRTRRHRLWIEFFIVPGVNDHPSELAGIKSIVDRVGPDKIQLNVLDRPGTEEWVYPADTHILDRVRSYLARSETIHRPVSDKTGRASEQTVAQRIISTVRRRPSTVSDLCQSLGSDQDTIWQHICKLIDDGAIEERIMPRGTFYVIRET